MKYLHLIIAVFMIIITAYVGSRLNKTSFLAEFVLIIKIIIVSAIVVGLGNILFMVNR